MSEGGLRSLIKATYEQLGLATYFTTGESCQAARALRRGRMQAARVCPCGSGWRGVQADARPRPPGEKESRAWTFRQGMTAPQAAAVIHSDFEKGFIRAETVAYDAFAELGGFAGAREKGQLLINGRDYIVQDGDVLVFRIG